MKNMKFLFIKVLILYFISINTAFSEKIKFNGLSKLSLNDINELVTENIFIDLNQNQINEIIRQLYESDLIYDLKTSQDENFFNIEIEEAKIVENIFINGNKFLEDEDLYSIINTKPKRLIDKKILNNDMSFLYSYYKSSGYNDASITIQIEKFSSDRVNIIFDIFEGNTSKILNINFYGNKFFSDRYLRDIIKSEDIGFFNILNKGSNLNPELFEFDLSLIKNSYDNKGFFESSIKYELLKSSLSNYNLNFYIEEGERTQIKSVNYEFLSDHSSNELDIIFKSFNKTLDKQKYFDKEIIEFQLEKLNDFLVQKNKTGSFFTFNFDPNSNYNVINFIENKIDPIIINKIDIQGNTITKDNTIRSKLLFESGDLLFQEEIIKTKENLDRLKYINKSNISYSTENNKANILIELDENKKTGNFLVAGSVSGDTGLGFAFGLKDNNLFGTGNEINSNFNINPDKTTFSINYTAYSLSKNYLRHTYSIFNEDEDFSDSYGFKSRNYGLGYTIGLKINERSNFSSGVKYQNVKASNPTKNISAINDNIGTFDNLTFSLNYNFDTTNDIFYPTNGTYQSINFLLSPEISDDPYYKFNVSSNFYKLFNNKNNFVFVLNNFGYADAFNGNLKTVNTFALGGLNFKGFDYRGIGPISNNIYLGGNNFLTSTIGYGGNFLFDKKDNVNAKIYMTSGSLWGSDYSIDNDFKLRSSIGISLDFLTPVGPLSLFYAIPINKSTDDNIRNFNFTLGTSF